MSKKLNDLIQKINNIEKNGHWTEREFWLGESIWSIAYGRLFKDGFPANEKEIEEFLKLKEEFDK